MAFGLNLSKPLAIVGIILGAIIGLLLLAGFIGPYFDATASITENFTSHSTGSDTADVVLGVFGDLVIPLVLVLGLVGLVLSVAYFRGSR